MRARHRGVKVLPMTQTRKSCAYLCVVVPDVYEQNAAATIGEVLCGLQRVWRLNKCNAVIRVLTHQYAV